MTANRNQRPVWIIHAAVLKYDIIASNFRKMGKLGDENDLRCVGTGKYTPEVGEKHCERSGAK